MITNDISNLPQRANSSDKGIKTTIKYDARDSIRFNVIEQKVYLYGDAYIFYGEMKLWSDVITIDWAQSLFTATYSVDSAGKRIGVPHFKDGDSEYEAEKIVYNYETSKGYIKGIVTSDGQGFLTGNDALKDEDDNLLIYGAKYTTCNLREPHYHFRLRKTKVTNKKRIYTNFFNLFIDEIPLPLGLPFGIFPIVDKKASGVVFPTWGQDASRGFYLRDGGYYWAINDYIGAKLLGEIYSNGGWGATGDINYKKRYAYNGRLNISYRDVVRNNDEYNRESRKDYKINWSHTPKVKGGRSFSANVNYATTTFNRNNTVSIDSYLANTLKSNIRYYMPLKGTPFNASFNVRHEQNNRTGIVNMTLPDFNISMNRLNPFKAKGSIGKKSTVRKFYESINVQYAFDLKNRITNAPIVNRFPFSTIDTGEELDTIDFTFGTFNQVWNNKELGMKHTIPVNGTMKLGPFSLNGSFNYTDYWYPKSFDYAYSDSGVVVSENGGLQRAYSYNGGVNLTTNLYGMYAYKGKRARQIRHTMRPSVGVRMSPDYQADGYIFRTVQTDSLGNEVTLSKFNGLIFAAPTSRRAASMTFGITNILEMKQKAIRDTAQDFKKIKLLENLSVNSSYNFVADSFRLANFNISANTNLFNLLNVRFSSVLDPYTYIVDSSASNNQLRVSTFAWDVGEGIGNMTSWSLALTTNLNPQAFRRRYKNQQQLTDIDQALIQDPSLYVDFNIPWSLNLSYNFRKTQLGFLDPTTTQSLQARGDMNISKTWKIGYAAAYDFENKKIVTPRLNFYKDLHCWEMRITWVPWGPRTMYEFYINVKASILQDLKWSRRRSFYDQF